MNEELKAKLLTLASNAEKFASEEIPELAREVINWHFWTNAIAATSALIILIGGLQIMSKGIKYVMEDSEQNRSEPRLRSVLFSVAGAIASGASFIALCISTTCAAKAIVAPRLVLLDQIKDLL